MLSLQGQQVLRHFVPSGTGSGGELLYLSLIREGPLIFVRFFIGTATFQPGLLPLPF